MPFKYIRYRTTHGYSRSVTYCTPGRTLDSALEDIGRSANRRRNGACAQRCKSVSANIVFQSESVEKMLLGG